ncbi:hypothetical protein ARMSODRAFT_967894 [Armillaria solidipes]|uniref:Uncharacterized protein n=1 Tax=Armillaria solidipes TaxID=1076256 RepID=A0A2H3AKE3_9AGAR|nr:hypothetical protein ARMSODRAFT_967894 [Armillaria solidipes]
MVTAARRSTVVHPALRSRSMCNTLKFDHGNPSDWCIEAKAVPKISISFGFTLGWPKK